MSKNPEIRFKDDVNDWEEKEIDNILKEYSERNPDNYPAVAVGKYGIRKREEIYGKELSKDISRNKVIKKDTLTIGMGSTQIDIGILKNNEFYSVSPAYHTFNINDINNVFLESYLKKYNSEFSKMHMVTGARQGKSVDIKGFLNEKVVKPNSKIQGEIANLLSSFDKKIELEEETVAHLQSVKAGMLQKMFPRDGQKVPEIRFAGFTDDWEQRKFGEFTELKSASRVHKEEWTSEGVPFYRSSDVMSAINGTQNEKAFISEELYEKLSATSGKLEEGDVLVTGGGSVGNPYIVPNNEPLYTKDADLLWIKNQGRFDAYFIYEFFFSPTFRKYLKSISHVGTIAHYTITQLSETPVFLPSLEEQKRVGDFFKNLDNLITLHQRKCEKLKDIKEALLNKLLV